LQDNLNQKLSHQSRAEYKGNEVLSTIARTTNETNHVIDKLKMESDKLFDDNLKLLAKVSKVSQEVERSQIELDRQSHQIN